MNAEEHDRLEKIARQWRRQQWLYILLSIALCVASYVAVFNGEFMISIAAAVWSIICICRAVAVLCKSRSPERAR